VIFEDVIIYPQFLEAFSLFSKYCIYNGKEHFWEKNVKFEKIGLTSSYLSKGSPDLTVFRPHYL